MGIRAEIKTTPLEHWGAHLIIRHDAEDEVAIKGFITKPSELRRFIETLRKLAAYLPEEQPARTLPIMPSQRGGLARAAQRQSGRGGA
jgi:hypothetical protein